MTTADKIRLEDFRPMWKGWIKGILREVDQAERARIQLTKDTLIATDLLEDLTRRLFSQPDWYVNLLERLQRLEDWLLEERNSIAQRALDLTQALILEIRGE
jgi:hypothetical protein